MSIAVVDDSRFDRHRSQEPHPERAERLGAARAGLQNALPESARLDVPSRPVSPDEARRVHTVDYLERLERALERGWGHLDGDTYFCPDTKDAAWHAAGGAVELCHAIMEGRARRGIALLRPPGHHACSSRAMGFCILNNVAIAAAEALSEGAERVAIVDWDVHHGNGTQEIFYDDPRVLFVSTHQSPLYPGTGSANETGSGEGDGYTVNIPMPSGSDPNAFGEAFRLIVLPILDAFSADLVLVSAGLDAHRRDPLATLELDAPCFGAMTTALAQHVDEQGHGRLALLLEGGYDLEAIEVSFSAMVGALRGVETSLPDGPISEIVRRSLASAARAAGARWKLSVPG